MQRTLLVVATAASTILLAGCAGTVETTRLNHRYEADTAVRGVSYALPMLQYDITVTHTLSGCSTPGDTATDTKATSFQFDTRVDRTARYIPGERFNVDYRKLSGLFRTSTFDIEYYPNGTIKSVGAAAEDKTADAIKSAAKLAAGVIAMTSGRPDAAVSLAAHANGNKMMTLFQQDQQESDHRVYDCSDEAVALLAALEVAMNDVKAARTALADANDVVEMLSRRFAFEISKDGDAEAWDKAVTDQFKAQRVLTDKLEALEKAKKPLSASYQITWPTDRLPKSGELPFADKFASGGKLRDPWAKLVAIRPLVTPVLGEIDVTKGCSVIPGNTPLTCLSSHMDLVLHFVSDWPEPKVRTRAEVQEDEADHRRGPVINDRAYVSAVETTGMTLDGLLYREPARGGVVICLKKSATPTSCGDDPLAKPEMVNFPQAGQLRFIPFSVLPFQGKDQTIEFTADGYPSKISLKSTKAAGAEALGAGADGLTTVADAIE
jgi:hypothetical protein